MSVFYDRLYRDSCFFRKRKKLEGRVDIGGKGDRKLFSLCMVVFSFRYVGRSYLEEKKLGKRF